MFISLYTINSSKLFQEDLRRDWIVFLADNEMVKWVKFFQIEIMIIMHFNVQLELLVTYLILLEKKVQNISTKASPCQTGH